MKKNTITMKGKASPNPNSDQDCHINLENNVDALLNKRRSRQRNARSHLSRQGKKQKTKEKNNNQAAQ